MRLNLACGQKTLPDYVNIDKYPLNTGVIVHDLLTGIPYEDNSIEEIYVSHFLEHLKVRHEAIPFLRECNRVLIPGGNLIIVTPDLEQIRAEPADINLFASKMFGDGRTDTDYHVSGWYRERYELLGADGCIHFVPLANPDVRVWYDMILTSIKVGNGELTVIYQKVPK
jgi:SAM-dependent methyltransferase